MNIHLGIYPYYCMPKVGKVTSLVAETISFSREKKKKKVRCILINTTNYYYYYYY